MPRAPFNTTCDVYCGPESASPGALRGTFDCRLVLQTGIVLTGTGHPVRVSWVTMDAIQPRGSWDIPSFDVTPGKADQIAIPSGTLPAWWVIFSEKVDWKGRPVYYRAHVAALPLPPDGDDEPPNPGGPWALGDVLLLLGSENALVAESQGGLLVGNESEVTFEP